MNAKSNIPEQGDDKAADVAGKALAQDDTDQGDSPATPDDEAAAQPGNVLPTPPLPLPITPDLVAPVVAGKRPFAATVASTPVAAMATRTGTSLDTLLPPAASRPGDATCPPLSDTAPSVDAAPARPAASPVDALPVPPSGKGPSLVNAMPAPASPVAVPLDAGATAKPAIDPATLETLRQATALPTASAPLAAPATTPAFRLVAMPMAATAGTVSPPRLSSGPLTVTQPAQATATVGLLAAVMPRSAPPIAPTIPTAPGAATLDVQVSPDATPPLAMTTLPNGPLTVIQPGQAPATVGMLASALRDRSTTKGRDEDSIDGLTTVATGVRDPAALATGELARPVTATGAADQAPLDMTQPHWPQGMIDRIDRMREDAATADTRIQLSPDALGGIAVAIRHDERGTHLHFTAEQARTATMLADAHATLARLAEDKGMRLGDTGVATGSMAGGTGGSDMGQSMGQSMRDQRAPAQPVPVMPSRPRGPDAALLDEAAAGSSATVSSTTPSTRIA